MTHEEIRILAKQIVDRVPGGMEGPEVAELAMLLVSALVFQAPIERREEVITQLKRGFQTAITQGEIRGELRQASSQL